MFDHNSGMEGPIGSYEHTRQNLLKQAFGSKRQEIDNRLFKPITTML